MAGGHCTERVDLRTVRKNGIRNPSITKGDTYDKKPDFAAIGICIYGIFSGHEESDIAVNDYNANGKLVPDLVVPMSEHRTFKYFKGDSLEKYAE